MVNKAKPIRAKKSVAKKPSILKKAVAGTKRIAKTSIGTTKKLSSSIQQTYTGTDLDQMVAQVKAEYMAAGDTAQTAQSKAKAQVTVATGRTKHHRSKSIPKSVRKWIGKTVRHQKVVEKSIKKLLKVTGATSYARKHTAKGSRGVITPAEAIKALSR